MSAHEPRVHLGEIDITSGAQIVEHVFRVENQSDRTISILGTNSTCGCLVVDSIPRSIDAGRGADVRIAIHITEPEEVLQSLRITPETGDPLILVVGATGRADRRLRAFPGIVRLDSDHWSEIVLTHIANAGMNFEPSGIDVRGHDSIEWHVGPWELVHTTAEGHKPESRHQAMLRVRGASSDGREIEILVGDLKTSVRLRPVTG